MAQNGQEVIKILMLGNGLGFSRTNPVKYIVDDPPPSTGFTLYHNYNKPNECGTKVLDCIGDQEPKTTPKRTGRADKDSTWWFADNAPSSSGVPAGSFGYLYKNLLDYNIDPKKPKKSYFLDIEVYFDTTKIADVIKHGNYDICISGSKGNRQLIDGAIQSGKKVSLILINGGSTLLRRANSLPPKHNITSIVFTHGGLDRLGDADDADISGFLNKGTHNNVPYMIYKNKKDGHNPRSLVFPTDIKNFRQCDTPLPITVLPTTALPGQNYLGTNRNKGMGSHLINFVTESYQIRKMRVKQFNRSSHAFISMLPLNTGQNWIQNRTILSTCTNSEFKSSDPSVASGAPGASSPVLQRRIQSGGSVNNEYKYITDPSNNIKYSIFSNKGRSILKSYITTQKGGGRFGWLHQNTGPYTPPPMCCAPTPSVDQLAANYDIIHIRNNTGCEIEINTIGACPRSPCPVGTMITELQDNQGDADRSIQWNYSYIIPTNSVGDFVIHRKYKIHLDTKCSFFPKDPIGSVEITDRQGWLGTFSKLYKNSSTISHNMRIYTWDLRVFHKKRLGL